VYCLPVSICIAGGLLHSFTWADVVEAGKLVVGKLVVDFEEHAINGTNMVTKAKNRRSNFGYFIIPPKNIKSGNKPYISYYNIFTSMRKKKRAIAHSTGEIRLSSTDYIE
jgi:hypothetical protein